MKKRIQFLLAAVLAISVTFIGCKKTDTSSTNDDSVLTQHSDDQNSFSQASDDIANDGNNAIDGYNAFEGKPGDVDNTAVLPCNADAILDSSGGLRRLTITYHGLNCIGNRNRAGVVVFSMPLAQHWKDAGAVLTMTVQNLVITRVSDNKSITIAGTTTVTNVTGGRIRDLATLGTITHAIASAGMTVTFDNGSSRSWQIAKQRVFTYNNGVVISTTGTHTDGSITGISEWGTNRFGNAFVTAINQPMIIRQNCNWRLTSGQITHYKLSATIVATFGLDSAGNPTTCPGLAPYYFKIVWTGANGVDKTPRRQGVRRFK